MDKPPDAAPLTTGAPRHTRMTRLPSHNDLTAAAVIDALRETLRDLFDGADTADFLRVGMEAVELEYANERLTGDSVVYLAANLVSEHALSTIGVPHPEAEAL